MIIVMLSLLFIFAVARAQFPPPSNIGSSGGAIPLPSKIGDSAICLNCVDYTSVNLNTQWTCSLYRNNECVEQSYDDIGLTSCNNITQAQIIFNAYEEYVKQCDVYVYNLIPTQNNTLMTGCYTSNNLTRCYEYPMSYSSYNSINKFLIIASLLIVFFQP